MIRPVVCSGWIETTARWGRRGKNRTIKSRGISSPVLDYSGWDVAPGRGISMRECACTCPHICWPWCVYRTYGQPSEMQTLDEERSSVGCGQATYHHTQAFGRWIGKCSNATMNFLMGLFQRGSYYIPHDEDYCISRKSEYLFTCISACFGLTIICGIKPWGIWLCLSNLCNYAWQKYEKVDDTRRSSMKQDKKRNLVT